MRVYLLLYLATTLINPTITAQPSFTIKLRLAEASESYTLYHDEPLTFTTTLLNENLQKNLEWNQSADEWLAKVEADYKAGKITKEEFDKETALVTNEKKPVKKDTIGSISAPWYQQMQFRTFLNNDTVKVPWPVAILGDPPENPLAILDEHGYYITRHHLSPEQVAMLQPGTYKIQVLLAGVWSNAVTVEIKKQNMPQSVSKSTEMQLRLGKYFLEQKDADKALKYSEAILKKDPDNINAIILSGESYALKKDYRQALIYFETALKKYERQFPNSTEPPEYITIMIATLKEML